MLDKATVARIQDEVTLAIHESQEFADKSPYPAAEELYTHVYAN
jgi:TPP-dependent pyruvate/acetoin dehydrogenase alpha subunit